MINEKLFEKYLTHLFKTKNKNNINSFPLVEYLCEIINYIFVIK